MLFSSLSLVKTLKGPIMPFIESPRSYNRYPQLVGVLLDDGQGLDGTFQIRGKGHVKFITWCRKWGTGRRVNIPFSFKAWAPSWASLTPFAERSTSVQPVKRFSWFHTDSPWRTRTILYFASAIVLQCVPKYFNFVIPPLGNENPLDSFLNRVYINIREELRYNPSSLPLAKKMDLGYF